MQGRDNIDLKIILSITNAYQELYERGEITSGQLNRVLSLIDNYHQFSTENFEEKLREIF